MKHIAKNNIVAISADYENPNFPATRMLDEHPKRRFVAPDDVFAVEITADISGGCSDILLAGTNADSAVVSVVDPNEMSWGDDDTWGDGDIWANTTVSVTGAIVQNSQSQAMLIELSDTVDVPCVATINLRSFPGSTFYCGIATANIAETYGGKNPRYGISNQLVDYSIIDENSNGSRYYKKRDVVRSWNLSALMTRENALKLRDNFILYGELPHGWKLTDGESTDWVAYARFDGPPTISHDYLTMSTVNFNLTEVL